MNFQHSIFSSAFVILVVFMLCIFWLPITSARNSENSKSELRDSGMDGQTANGKMNNKYNTASASSYYTGKQNLRAMLISPKDYQQKLHSKFPGDLDLMDFLLEDEDEDRSKRFDDYGHMRFGKRGGEEQFDDYGHMRFGRNV